MSRSSQILLVTFDPSIEIDPLTVTAKNLAESVELYLQRVAPGPMSVVVADDTERGVALHDGQLVAAFTFAPLGGESR